MWRSDKSSLLFAGSHAALFPQVLLQHGFAVLHIPGFWNSLSETTVQGSAVETTDFGNDRGHFSDKNALSKASTALACNFKRGKMLHFAWARPVLRLFATSNVRRGSEVSRQQCSPLYHRASPLSGSDPKASRMHLKNPFKCEKTLVCVTLSCKFVWVWIDFYVFRSSFLFEAFELWEKKNSFSSKNRKS